MDVVIIETEDAFKAMLEDLKQYPVLALDTETVGKESLPLFERADECERLTGPIQAKIDKAERVYREKFKGRNKRCSAVIRRFEAELRECKSGRARFLCQARESKSGLQFWNCYAGMVQVSTEATCYLIRPRCAGADLCGDLASALNSALVLIVHNAQFDYKILKHCLGITLHCRNLWDTFIVEKLITNGRDLKCGLEETLERRFGVQLDKSLRVSNWLGDWTDGLISYATADVKYLQPLKDQQRQELIDSGQWQVYEQERKLLPINADMEMNGLGVDVAYLKEIAPLVALQVAELEEKCKTVLGIDNPNSNPQVLAALQTGGLRVKDTNKKTLTKYEGHPLVDLLLSYRKYAKLSSTYLQGFIDLAVDMGDHFRLFASFNPSGTDSGRWSSSGPNLQNLPASEVEV